MTRHEFMSTFDDIVFINRQMSRNVTPQAVTDELGFIRDLKKKLDKKEKFLSEWLKNEARNNETSQYEGEEYLVSIGAVEQERISPSLVREHVPEDILPRLVVVLSYDKLTCTKRPTKR